jgi:D-xylose transport system substrate-binding protein
MTKINNRIIGGKMQNKTFRLAFTLIAMVMIVTSLWGCGGQPPAKATQPAVNQAPATPAGGKAKVGLSFSDFETPRWANEEEIMRNLLTEKGYVVLSQQANHDVKLQSDQIDNMVAQGAKAVIVVAEDGSALVTSVDKAADAGVKVIAYDRLIPSPRIAGYISFDNIEVGRQQADGVMKALGIDTWDPAAKGKARVVELGGSATDNNAILFRKGQNEIVNKYVDAGKVEIIADQWVKNWDAGNAEQLMGNILSSINNKVDAVVASNDNTALGALQAMKAQGLAGKVPISGQDATAEGCNSIVKGELTVTILKDIRNLAPLVIDMTDKLLNGTPVENLKEYTMAELTNNQQMTGNVQALFLPVQQVNKDNVFDLCVKNGFQKYEDVYRDIPDAQRPPKP